MAYPQYFLPHQHQLQFPAPVQPQHREPGVQPQHTQLPIDPSLSLYSSDFFAYPQPQQQQQQQQQHHAPLPHIHQLPPPALSSSPSSDGSTPPADQPPSLSRMSSNGNGKRPAATTSGSVNSSRKKPRKSEKDDDNADLLTQNGDKEEGKVKPTRGSRACTVCRRLKMKCVGAEQGPPCKRCVTGNYECIFEESNRGKRSSKKHEQFQRTLRKMERTIATVLQSISNPGMLSMPSGMVSRSPSPSAQTATTNALLESPSPPPSAMSLHHPHMSSPKLHSLPDNTLNPLGLLAEASLANRRLSMNGNSKPNGADGGAGIKVGVANDTYFKPGPMTILPLRRLYIERQVQPEMLSFVSTEEVMALFKIFFDSMSIHAPLLCRDFHTPSLVCSRSPFLLTTICAIASKFHEERPDLHSRLNALAKKLAFSVPERGYKSVEIVQAYLLLSLWGCGPTERYEQDKTWLLLGMGIRMATDLNLHRKTSVPRADTVEGQARDKEVHNRERTWLMCFVLDRSFSAQMGKPHTIKEDFIIRNVSQWWRHSVAVPTDSGLAGYVELQRILSRSLDFLYSGTHSASGLQTECDYLLVIKTIETQLLAWNSEWAGDTTEIGTEDPNFAYRKLIAKFYFSYSMLVVNSFGLQNALERSAVDMGHFFSRCHASAVACATVVRDELGPAGYLKYSPDSHFVLTSYAVLSLLKLVRPEFQAFQENEAKAIALVKDIADLMESVAAGPLHTPALYSTFLRALISAKTDPLPVKVSDEFEYDAAAVNGDAPLVNGRHGVHDFGTHGPDSLGLKMLDTSTNPFSPSDFQFTSEMGPVADSSTFPPTMAAGPQLAPDDHSGVMSMDSILSNGFWDSMLVPGYSNALEGLSGGFVYGAGGSGLITPHIGSPGPYDSGSNSPIGGMGTDLTQTKLNAAFEASAVAGEV